MQKLFLLFTLCAALAFAQADAPASFTGEITDSMCARNRSHAESVQLSSDMGKTAASCTIACVDKHGAKFVLLDTEHKKTYMLSNQDAARKFAGRKVQVTGTLNKRTIEVQTISEAK